MDLSNEEIRRYSRQLIIPKYGIDSQIKLKNKKALIVGCGGLGCPAALYLCTSGVGTLGLVDNDVIEISNIHRQIAHDLPSIGRSKAQNLTEKCRALNDKVNYNTHECLFDKEIALTLIDQYDIVLDCTDNVITRYLISDVCVLLNKPLVSGSALKFEGQLTVYNYLNGPCYRCLYPKAPAPETVSNCSDAGILGPIVGMIGSLQALEAIKIMAEIGSALNGRMMIFDGFDFTTRVIKLRPRQSNTCVMCKQANSAIDASRNFLESFDYTQFCGVSNYNDKGTNISILDLDKQRISCQGYNALRKSEQHLLIDVRPECQFKICALPNSINIPIDGFDYEKEKTMEAVKKELDSLSGTNKSIYVVCRLGNDSQIAVQALTEYFQGETEQAKVEIIKDLVGGITEWSKSVDVTFPRY